MAGTYKKWVPTEMDNRRREIRTSAASCGKLRQVAASYVPVPVPVPVPVLAFVHRIFDSRPASGWNRPAGTDCEAIKEICEADDL